LPPHRSVRATVSGLSQQCSPPPMRVVMPMVPTVFSSPSRPSGYCGKCRAGGWDPVARLLQIAVSCLLLSSRAINGSRGAFRSAEVLKWSTATEQANGTAGSRQKVLKGNGVRDKPPRRYISHLVDLGSCNPSWLLLLGTSDVHPAFCRASRPFYPDFLGRGKGGNKSVQKNV
jgi:hypothetical protein